MVHGSLVTSKELFNISVARLVNYLNESTPNYHSSLRVLPCHVQTWGVTLLFYMKNMTPYC